MADAPPAPAATDTPAKFDPRYVVERELGRGAMGRVFLARDLRLDRLVAIKALAPGNRDEQDLRRLELEARTAGSLNHPNILAVHDIGASDAGPFIVSEYLRGKNLRQLIDGEQEKLPAAQVVNLMAQFAAGLATAHENGIVHRDLKPENLFITEEGWLKILDFGIAKRTVATLLPSTTPPSSTPVPAGAHAVQRQPTPSPYAPPLEGQPLPASAIDTPQSLPTPAEVKAMSQLQPLTNPGAILGTVGYMSPEQVRGLPADARSDVFAFGVILYELLAGAQAFTGKTPFMISFAILKDEPKPLPADAPPELRALALRCLRKDPAQRPQSARELAKQLEALRPTGDQPRLPARASKRWWAALGVLVSVASGAVVFAVKLANRAPPSFKQLTFHPGAVWSARFGKDGQVVYSAAWEAKTPHLFVATPGNPESKQLDVPDAMLLASSPTGDLAVLLRPVLKGSTFRLGELVLVHDGKLDPAIIARGVDAADFAPDGKLALARQQDGKTLVECPPGHLILSRVGHLPRLAFSQSGDRLAYILRPLPQDDRGEVGVIDMATGSTTTLVDGVGEVHGLGWSKSGDEIWFSGVTGMRGGQMALHAVSLKGVERVVLQSATDLALQAVSGGDEVLVTEPNRRLALAAIDENGRTRDLSWFDRAFIDDISSDGRSVLITVSGEAVGGVGQSIYLRPTDGSPARLIGPGFSGAIPPAGWPIFVFNGGVASLYGSDGTAKPFDTHGLALNFARFTPDGAKLVVVASKPGEKGKLFVLPLDGGPPVSLRVEAVGTNNLAVSPDGNMVAFSDQVSAPHLVSLAGEDKGPLNGALAGESVIAWTARGTLLVARLSRPQVQIDELDLATGARKGYRSISANDSGALMIARVRVPSSGAPLVYNYATFTTHLYLLRNVR